MQELFALQEKLELQYAKESLNLYFESDREILVKEPIDYLMQYICDIENKDYTYEAKGQTKWRDDLLEVDGWFENVEYHTLESIIMTMMTMVLTAKQPVTAQALVGIVFNKCDFEIHQRRLKLANVFLQALTESPRIQTYHTPDYIMFESKCEIESGLKKDLDQLAYPLPMVYPAHIKNNSSVGYRTFRDHIISGGKLKQHDKHICLDHINRLNRTQYKTELRLGMLVELKFDPTKKYKDNGELETDIDVQKRLETHKRLETELPARIKIMNKYGNRYYLNHNYDTRLRTYVKAFHFNYLGTKFIKAMVQLQDSEIIKPEF